MDFLNKSFSFFIQSNIYVSLATAFLSVQTKFIWNKFSVNETDFSIDLISYDTFFVFMSTLGVYNFHRLIRFSKKTFSDSKNPKLAFYFHHKAALILICCSSLLFSMLLLLKLPFERLLYFLIPGGLISLFYVLGFKIVDPIRKWKYAKIFSITFCWILMVTVIPIYSHANYVQIVWEFTMLYCGMIGAFIFAITLPFDIRDLEFDRKEAIKTIPGKIGIKNAIYLSIFSLLVSLLFAFQLYHLQFINAPIFGALTVTSAITGWLILRLDKFQPDYYYSVLIEGSMFLQFFLVLLASYI